MSWGVTVSNLSVTWEGSKDSVLNNIDLTLEFGSSFNRLPIMGRSGTGKSTLMYILAAMKWPSDGTVNWRLPNGETVNWVASNKNQISVEKWHELRSNHFGFAFQGSTLLPYLSIEQNLTFPLEQKGVDQIQCKEKAYRALLDVLINEEGETPDKFLNKYPHELSGGQKQRVALAQAFISSPTVLFADEPTGALDIHTRREIMQLLTQWLEKGQGDRALIWVTHHHNDPIDNDATCYLDVENNGCALKKVNH